MTRLGRRFLESNPGSCGRIPNQAAVFNRPEGVYIVCSYEDYQLRVKLEGTEKRRDQRLVQPPQTSLPSQVNVLPLSCRCKVHLDPLPSYFLVEEILCSEAELRFRLSITELEKKVVSALKVFSESQGHECTLLDLMNHLQRKTTYARINEMPLPSGEFAVTAPHIITSMAGTCIFGGSHKEIIQVTTGGLERALILCLLVYYIKSLQYPYAFSQMLLLTQKLVLPCEVVPAGAICKRLKSFLALLKKRSIA